MPTVTLDFPDDLAQAAHEEGIDLSALMLQALRYRVAQRRAARWLKSAPLRSATPVTGAADVFAVLRTAREELESG